MLRRFLALCCSVLAVGGILASAPVPQNKPEAYPNWWFEQGAISRINAASVNYATPGTYPVAEDYAAANLGQLKNFAAKAAVEFDAKVPGGAGSEIGTMLTRWRQQSTAHDDFVVINLGQLKAVAAKFYVRLDDNNYIGSPIFDGRTFPWIASPFPADDYSVANLGQLKYIFSFDPGKYLYSTSVKLASGYEYTLVLKADGSVWSWGDNQDGQLGHGNTGAYWYPAKIEALSRIKAITAGVAHSLAVKADGTVWAWGDNGSGQLGDDTTEQRRVPVQVLDLTGVVAVTAGEGRSYALKNDGTVWGWGKNDYGYLGDGSEVQRRKPVQIGPGTLGNVVALAAGWFHCLALKADGTVWSWGEGYYGQLGNGGSDSDYPVQCGTINGVVAIAAGERHSLALKADGSVWAWGINDEGQLGDGTQDHRYYPVQVLPAGTYTYTAIAAGYRNSAALRNDGVLLRWGDNDYGQLGDGTTLGTSSPVTTGLTGITGVTTGKHTIVSTVTGELKSFGDNQYGQLGQGMNADPVTPGIVQNLTFANKLLTPILSADGGTYLSAPAVIVTALDDGVTLHYTTDGTEPTESSSAIASGAIYTPAATGYLKVKAFKAGRTSDTKTALYRLGDQIAAGENHTLALRVDGSVWSWGRNEDGRLGLGLATNDYYYYPTKIAGLAEVRSISAGYNHSLAVKNDGSVWAWGSDSHGQIGDGAGSEARLKPVQVVGLAGQAGQPKIVAVAAGYEHSLALTENGKVWSWGDNGGGQGGAGTTQDNYVPVETVGLKDVIAIAAAQYRSYALTSDGRVWRWGLSLSNTPVVLGSMVGAVTIAATNEHVLVLRADGSIYSWGSNGNGELGDGTTDFRENPVPVTGVTGRFVAIAAGYGQSVALRSDGAVYTWGKNDRGQLGLNSTDNQFTPQQLFAPDSNGIKMLAAGGRHTILASAQGELKGFGYNEYGQLGLGDPTDRRSPTTIQEFTFADRLGLPTLRPDGGAYLSAPAVTVGSPDPGVTLHYTIDGSEPTEGSASITVGATLTAPSGFLKVKAFKAGRISSDTKPAVYRLGDQIAAGKMHTLGLRADGSVWSWGRGEDGRLGHGITGNYYYPTKIAGLAEVKAISAGFNHSLAVKNDGSVWAWGSDRHGQIGDGAGLESRLKPVQVTGLGGQTGQPKIVAVAAGYEHSLALTENGRVWSWGDNGGGQGGAGTNQDNYVPVETVGLTEVTAIAAAQYKSYALTSDGRIWRWGLSLSNTPVVLGSVVGAVAIAATNEHVLVLRADGSIYSWGSNGNGELGDGTTQSRDNPVPVTGVTGRFVAIAAGYGHSAALRSDGAVFTWGKNDKGQLGLNVAGNQATPQQLFGPEVNGINTLAAGDQYTILAYKQGELKGFGYNEYGQLGVGDNLDRSSPTTVQGLTFANKLLVPQLNPDGGAYLSAPQVTVDSIDPGVALRYTTDGSEPTGSSPLITVGASLTAPSGFIKVKAFKDGRVSSDTKTALYHLGDQMAVGENHTLALRSDGSVWAWGYNSNGQLGDASTTQRSVPTRVSNLPSCIGIAAGYRHSLALGAGGSVWAWGYNFYGQLGDGTTTQRTVPVQVSGLSGVVALAAGDGSSYALKTDGTVWAWGNNGSSRLGDGTSINRAVPVQIIAGEPKVIAISAGASHALALRADGTVWAWGNGQYLGLIDGSYSSVPVPCGTLFDAVAISAGQDHSLAIRADGRIWAWGSNSYRQLGDGTTGTRQRPFALTSLTGSFVSISAGFQVSAAVGTNGAVYVWGRNDSGQLGQGSTAAFNLPQAVLGLAPTCGIAASLHLLTVEALGDIYAFHAWGNNGYGELGDSTLTRRLVPVAVAFDVDLDGLLDRDEVARGTYPFDSDSDDDTLSDGIEVANGLNPLNSADGTAEADLDQDGLPNRWEIIHQFPLNDPANAALDTDGDGRTNLQEYTAGTDPRSKLDSDGDTLPNDWETAYQLDPNNASDGTVTADSDGDGVTNRFEYLLGFDPRNPHSGGSSVTDNLQDRDGDGLPDLWEQTYFGSPIAADAAADTDGDGLTNLQEYAAGTLPTSSSDTDGDTLPNDWETLHQLDPHNGADGTPTADTDGDGVTNRLEYLLGFDPQKPSSGTDGIPDKLKDRDGDGLPDVWEQIYFGSPTAADPAVDFEPDGLTNAEEYAAGTLPKNSDSDSDTLPDGWEKAHQLNPNNGSDGAPDADSDADGVPNRLEYVLGFDPWNTQSGTGGILDSLKDRDGDGLPDIWEQIHFGSPTAAVASEDFEPDGLTNAQEYAAGTDPKKADSDGDKLPDGWEVTYQLNPTNAADAAVDSDGDGVSNGLEYVLGFDPRNTHSGTDGILDSLKDRDGDTLSDLWEQTYFNSPTDAVLDEDTDNDQMLDAWEIAHGLNPRYPADANADPDGDGQSNLVEFQHSTDPADYYNGATPVITVLEGPGQAGPPGYFLPVPWTVQIRDASGRALVNAPVTFQVPSDGGQLATSPYASGSLPSVLTVRTDSAGLAWVYWKL